MADARQAFVFSLVAAFDGNMAEALAQAKISLESEFSAEVAQVVAVLSLKAGAYNEALSFIERACSWLEEKVKQRPAPLFPPEYFELCVFRARTLDLLGKRSEAVARYREIAAHPDLEDRHLRKLAEKARPYSAKALSRIVMPYSSYIPFE